MGFTVPLHTPAILKDVTPPINFPGVVEEKGKGVTVAGTAIAAGVAGAAIGVVAATSKNLAKKEKDKDKGKSDSES